MRGWEDEDFWEDVFEPEPPMPRRPHRLEEDDEGPVSQPLPRPIGEQLEGSIYAIPDSDWGFIADFRTWHPGVCARCDLAAKVTFCFKGTDARRMRSRYTVLVVHPTVDNRLRKSTAFSKGPIRIKLETLIHLHNETGYLGEIELPQLYLLQQELNWFLGEEEKEP